MIPIFYFKLHPLQWEMENDGETIFRALELADGTYLVSWKPKLSNEPIEVLFNQEEVTKSMALGHWIITDENGEQTS